MLHQGLFFEIPEMIKESGVEIALPPVHQGKTSIELVLEGLRIHRDYVCFALIVHMRMLYL